MPSLVNYQPELFREKEKEIKKKKTWSIKWLYVHIYHQLYVKTKIKKQAEQKQTQTDTGDIPMVADGRGCWVKEVKGLERTNRQLQNSPREVKYSTGNSQEGSNDCMVSEGWALSIRYNVLRHRVTTKQDPYRQRFSSVWLTSFFSVKILVKGRGASSWDVAI